MVKAYKGFNKELQCHGGYQYKLGDTFEESDAKLCSHGFHACERPLDVFSYFAPGAGSRYCEVELDGVTGEREGDTKICGKKITIGAEIGIPGLVKAQIEYVKAHTTTEYTDPKLATAGEYGAATAGYAGAATAGYAGAATAGNRGAATSKGSASVGENGIACVRGDNVKVRGGLGALLVCGVEKQTNYDLATWAVAVVDGEKIKPDTWYTVVDGQFEEVESNG